MTSPDPALIHLCAEGEFPQESYVDSQIVESALEHGVGPLLDAAVRRQRIRSDREALLRLTMASLETAARNREATAALAHLVEVADSVGVRLGLLKGLSTGLRWYPDPDLRPAADVDVFVHPDDLPRFGALIGAFDRHVRHEPTFRSMVAEGRVFDHQVYSHGIEVDIHSDPINLLLATRQSKLIWQRTERISIPNGPNIAALDRELATIQALVNLMRDNFADLVHLNDARLMLSDSLDWGFIEEFAAEEGLTNIVRHSAGYVSEIFDQTSPFLPPTSAANSALVKVIFPARLRLRGVETTVRNFRRGALVGLAVSGRRRETALSLVQRFFPSRDVIGLRAPEISGPYPIRARPLATLSARQTSRVRVAHICTSPRIGRDRSRRRFGRCAFNRVLAHRRAPPGRRRFAFPYRTAAPGKDGYVGRTRLDDCSYPLYLQRREAGPAR